MDEKWEIELNVLLKKIILLIKNKLSINKKFFKNKLKYIFNKFFFYCLNIYIIIYIKDFIY